MSDPHDRRRRMPWGLVALLTAPALLIVGGLSLWLVAFLEL